VFNPFWVISFAFGLGFDNPAYILTIIYLLPFMSFAKASERFGILSHWMMPTQRDRVRGLLMCAFWCLGLPIGLKFIIGLKETASFLQIDIPTAKNMMAKIDPHGFWWVGGITLGVSSLVGALASSFSRASLYMMGAIAILIFEVALAFLSIPLARYYSPDKVHETIWLLIIIFIVTFLLFISVWWARRYLKAHTRREMWQGVAWGVLLGIVSLATYAFTVIVYT